MTDESQDNTPQGAADPPLHEYLKGTPEPRDVDPDSAQPDRDAPLDDEADEADEEVSDTRRRPPVALVIAGVLVLAVIGAGLAFLLPSGPIREADLLIPTNVPGATSAIPDSAAAPTALPLPAASGEYSSTEVIARVGEGTISRGDFVRQYQPGQDPAELLNQLIQVELVYQEAASEGVTADADAVTAQIEQIKQSQAGGDEAQFALFLDQVQVGTEENLRRLLERDSVVEKMVMRHTTAEQVRARHILIATDSTTDTAKLAELKAEAETLLENIEGGADFATLAAERSDDPGSKDSGGDLGWALRGLFVGPFDEAVFSMQAGERRLVETQFGFHIIEVIEAAQTRPLEDSALLQTPPGQQAFSDTFLPWIDAIQKQAEAAQKITIVVPAEQLVTTPSGA